MVLLSLSLLSWAWLDDPPVSAPNALAVAPAGDVDGDGRADLATADWFALTVHFGGPAAFGRPHSTELYWPKEVTARASAAGDVNGDGLADVLAYACDWVRNQHDLKVFYGDVTGKAAWDARVLEVPRCPEMAPVGDVDGDGYDDVVYGWAPDARVMRGGPSGLDTSALLPVAARSGVDISRGLIGLGDVNGDGFDDFAAGGDGTVVVYHGSTSGPVDSGVVFTGPVYQVGDIDGDGFDDLAVPAPPELGSWYDFYPGSATGLASEPMTRIILPSPHRERMLETGDFNGDGRRDVAVLDRKGFTILLFDGLATGFTEVPVQTIEIASKAKWEFFRAETRIKAMGDVDGDGADDLIWYLPAQSIGGETLLFTGYRDDDADGARHDDDCDDGDAAMGGPVARYRDADEDNFGSSEVLEACANRPGSADNADDCDDSRADVFPTALEVCDQAEVDEDCDGLVNDRDDNVDPGTLATWYPDGDADGFGDAARAYAACAGLEGHVGVGEDCDDEDPEVGPPVQRVPDVDGDGRGAGDAVLVCPGSAGYADEAGDCDDGDANVFPGATEVDDGIDNNCDGEVDELVERDDGASCGCATSDSGVGWVGGLLVFVALGRRRATRGRRLTSGARDG